MKKSRKHQFTCGPFTCPKCGSTEIEGQFWVSYKTDRITQAVDDGYDWCNDCDKAVTAVDEITLKKKPRKKK